MAASLSNRFLDQLRVLTRHEVDFIVVGGVAALLEGAPILTFDLDVLYDRSPANIARLLAALQELNARYRDPAGRHIVPDASKLGSFRFNLLLTDLGALDCLSVLDESTGYQELLPRTHEYEVADLRVRVLELEALIEAKERANRDKDRAVLPVLRQTLELKRTSET